MRQTLQALAIAAMMLAGGLPVDAQEGGERFLMLATSRTGTMETELNEAGAEGYRFPRGPGRRDRIRRAGGGRRDVTRPER